MTLDWNVVSIVSAVPLNSNVIEDDTQLETINEGIPQCIISPHLYSSPPPTADIYISSSESLENATLYLLHFFRIQ